MTRVRTVLKPLQASLYAALMAASVAHAEAPADDVFLQCDGEIRTRELAFQFGELEIRVDRNSQCAPRADYGPSLVLFTPGQCKLSDMKIACEDDKHGGIRQPFRAPAATPCLRAIARISPTLLSNITSASTSPRGAVLASAQMATWAGQGLWSAGL